MAGFSLELPPEDSQARECYRIAFRVAEGPFKEQLLAQRQDVIRRRLLKFTADQGIIDEEEELLDDPEDDEPYDEVQRDSAGQAAWINEMKKKAEDFTRLIKHYKVEREEAEEKVHKINGTMASDDGKAGFTSTQMKQAILEVAMQLNPNSAKCAEALGYFYMRTPAFFIQYDLAEITLPVSEAEVPMMDMQMRKQGKLPHVPPHLEELPPSQAWQMFEHIDTKIEQAKLQDDAAICDLLSLLAMDDLHGATQQHITRVVEQADQYLRQKDARLIELRKVEQPSDQSGAECPMVANWPDITKRVENSRAYDKLMIAINQIIHRGERHMSSKLSNAFQRQGEAGNLTTEKKIKAFKLVMESNFAEAERKDPLLHITPQVVNVLQTISYHSMAKLREELFALYGFDDLESRKLVDDEMGGFREKHWFERRQAAARVCELAKEGNELARNVICKRLLQDHHWMIRQMAITETFHLLAHIPDDTARFRELADVATKAMFDHPNEDLTARKPSAAEIQEIRNVQEAAEKAAIKELPHYSASARDHILSSFMHAADWWPITGRPRWERIQQELGHAVPKKASRPAAHSSLRKAREQQKSLMNE